MKNINLISIIILTLFASLINSAQADDYWAEVKACQKRSKDLFEQKKWLELEKLLNDARENKETVTNGTSKLPFYYDSLDVRKFHEKSDSDALWEGWYKSLDDWQKACPNSYNLPIVRIRFFTGYAWKARGSGVANTVTQEGWQLFGERLDIAEDIFQRCIEAFGDQPYPCPEIYRRATTIALGQSWDFDTIDKRILTPTIDHYPDYLYTYKNLELNFAEKWGGQKGDDYRLFLTVLKRIGGDLGKEVYARLLLGEKVDFSLSYEHDLVDWDSALDGIVESIKRSPNSTELVSISFHHAHLHKAQNTLADRLKTAAPVALNRFYKETPYGKSIQLMNANPHSSLTFEELVVPAGPSFNSRVESITSTNINNTYIVSYGYRGDKEISIKSGKTLNVIPSDERYAGLVAISKDGRKFVSISTYDISKNEKSTRIRMYEKAADPNLDKPLVLSPEDPNLGTDDYSDWKLIKELHYELGYIGDVVFTPKEDEILFVYHGARDKKTKHYKNARLVSYNWGDQDSEGETITKFPLGYTYSNMVIQDNSLYVYNYNIQKYDLNNLRQGPQLCKITSYKKHERIKKIVSLKGNSILIALTEAENIPYLVSISPKDGQVLSRQALPQVKGDVSEMEVVYDSSGNALVATSGDSGAISTWKIKKEGKQVNFTYESTLPTIGVKTYALEYFAPKAGGHYLLQGTKVGKVGVFKIK